jgi:hypothetical protein
MHELRVVIEEGRDELAVSSSAELEKVLNDAADQARSLDVLNIVSIFLPNADNLFLVVGGDDTVVGFNYGHGDPPYFVSKGVSLGTDPVLTAYLSLVHHTEFPRRYVIPIVAGLRAATEFGRTGKVPISIEWVETLGLTIV